MRKHRSTLVALSALVIGTLFTSPSLAVADTSHDVTSLVISAHSPEGVSSQMTLTFDEPTEVADILAVASSFGATDVVVDAEGAQAQVTSEPSPVHDMPMPSVDGENMTVQGPTVNGQRSIARESEQSSAAAGAANSAIYCNHHYKFNDSQGRFDVQRRCGGTTAPWGYRLSGSVRAIAAGPVSETGMDYTLDGVQQLRQAPHPDEPAGYRFHGTFRGNRGGKVLKGGSVLKFDDTFRFRHNVGPGGNAVLNIFGRLAFKARAYPLPPGSP